MKSCEGHQALDCVKNMGQHSTMTGHAYHDDWKADIRTWTIHAVDTDGICKEFVQVKYPGPIPQLTTYGAEN